MAVIQISRIQVRRGLQEDLPQLASGEFGWSVDEGRLWIGNGTLKEGAPQIGNTEILTSRNDRLPALRYTFKGQESGYSSQTGPVIRQIQDKFDDIVNFRDFITSNDKSSGDYTIALQRAIDQIFPQDYYNTVGVRRILHIPAGDWPITSITVPSFASLIGDGRNSTFIKKIGNRAEPLIRLRDSRGNLGNDMDPVTSQLPESISIKDLTLKTDVGGNIALLENCRNITFDNVGFYGANIAPVDFGEVDFCMGMGGSNISASSHITINHCSFANSNFGIVGFDDVSHINVDNCVFETLTSGVYGFGFPNAPRDIRVENSHFSNIAQSAIGASNGTTITSAFNYFGRVGYGDGEVIDSGTAMYPVMRWENPNNYSIADTFERSILESLDSPIVEIFTTVTSDVQKYSTAGSVQDTTGFTQTLLNNSTGNVSLEIYNRQSVTIDYSIYRGEWRRQGTIKASRDDSSAVYDDEYSESGDTGVVLSFNDGAYSSVLVYSVSSAGETAYLKYTIRSFI